MFGFLAAAWVSTIAALCFVWFHRRKTAAEEVVVSETLEKRLSTLEQRAARLELRANMRTP